VANDLINEKFSSYLSYTILLKKLFDEQQSITRSVIKHEIDSSLNWRYISAITKMNVYRILQESILNAIKYAKADNIYISINQELEILNLIIKDDGVGFSLKKHKKGIGLKNMQERVESLTGTFNISSEKFIGTTIIVNLPLSNQSPTEYANQHPDPYC
jgi:signal transduction histidine kinase